MTDTNVPSQLQLNALFNHYQNKRFSDAEKLSVSITQEFPTYPFGWKVLSAVLEQTGRVKESLVAGQKSVELAPHDPEALSNLGSLLKKLGRLDEAEASYKQAIALKPAYAEAYNNLGNTLKELGRLDEAEASLRHAIALKPDFAEAHGNLGNMLKEIGRLNEAEASYNQAISLKPSVGGTHYNLGNTLKELGRLPDAVESYTQAIALRPNYAEAFNNLGNTLKELGRLDEAEVSLRQAISFYPHFAQAHGNLGNTLKELGRSDEALESYGQAIALKPDFADAYVNFSLAIKNVRFSMVNRKLYSPLLQLLTNGNFARPNDLASSILSLLKHDPLIKHSLHEKNITKNLTEVTAAIVNLNKLNLLHHLMRLCPLPDLQFEGLFVAIRSFLLKNLDKIETSPELTYFLSTLSIHCFVNEYVYAESDEETQLIGELQAKIEETIAQTEQPEVTEIFCLASYRPLHHYDWCQKLTVLDSFAEVKARLIEEPVAEKVIAQNIPMLGKISDGVSIKVREQYEENPYPRWFKTGMALKAKSVAAVCDGIKLQLHSENIKSVTAPSILVAGCGTGQHAIGTACRFSNCHVTAVDLSLASLAYAQRKATELKITNLNFLQGDILDLGKLEQEFDIIESSGVLHHMDDPMAGWRVLTDLLKRGGLIRIGLYSDLARQHIVNIRREITFQKVGTSEFEIREFRRSLTKSNDKNHQLLTTSGDFFSLSTLRDLIFHVQEHRFTLPQIKSCLDELGLKFCGFENKDVILNFREFSGRKANMYDLGLWHHYEKRYPRAFAGMYQFWCQKL